MDEYLDCPYCHMRFLKKYHKSCGNCFACKGCEIYICPDCNREILIKTLPVARSG